jgi:hypothetical protein
VSNAGSVKIDQILCDYLYSIMKANSEKVSPLSFTTNSTVCPRVQACLKVLNLCVAPLETMADQDNTNKSTDKHDTGLSAIEEAEDAMKMMRLMTDH